MPRVLDILSALRAPAVWLLVMFMFLGPAGPGGALAFGSQACGDSCPCDEDAEEEHEDGTPSADECPEDCPSCGCSLGVALTRVAWSMPTTPPPSSPNLTPPPSNATATGMGRGVFRPPRAPI